MKIQNGFSIKPLSPEEKAQKLDGQMREAAEMYENYFLNEMVKAMRSTVSSEDGVIKKSFAEKIFQEKLDQQYVEGWAKKGGIGLADMIYEQLNQQMTGGAHKRGFMPKGALPIAPKMAPRAIPGSETLQMKTLPAGSGAKLEYRFQIEGPGEKMYEAQAPMPGKVVGSQTLDEGWAEVKLDHGQGLKSELTFPGRLAEMVIGDEVRSGQKLGDVDSRAAVLAWKLDWV